MRRSTLYVGILSLLNATNLWCHCEDDEVTLLQLNKRVNMSHVPSVNAPHVHSVETLLQAALRAKALAASGENPEAVNLAIEAVQEALEQMKPNIQGEHDQVQTQIQRQFEEIQACHSSEGHGASVVTGLQDDMADIAACLHDVDTAVGTHTTACGLWETHVAETALPSCASGSDSQQFFSAAQSLHTWVHDQWHILEPLHENCQQAIIALNDERVRCDPLIAEYNTVFCQHFLSCRLLSACHNHELAIYNQMKIDTLPGQTFRQNQWRTVEQAQCILAHTSTAMDTSETADDASLTSCDDDISVEHLVLTFPEPAVWPECPAPQAGDPQCPDVNLPDGWTDGSGVWHTPTEPPPPPPPADLVAEGAYCNEPQNLYYGHDGMGYSHPSLAACATNVRSNAVCSRFFYYWGTDPNNGQHVGQCKCAQQSVDPNCESRGVSTVHDIYQLKEDFIHAETDDNPRVCCGQ